MIALTQSAVLAVPPVSVVRASPDIKVLLVERLIRLAASIRKLSLFFCPSHSSIQAPDRIVAIGLAMPLPAMSGAVPWDAWKYPNLSPISAAAAIPMPPIVAAPRSDSRSPTKFSVTTTSNVSGRSIM